jgi:transcriptional regulator with XRE-family HTH domain
MDINLRLKELRENKKMTQVQLEKAIGKSRRMISFYEKGTNAPDYETIVKYAEYFKVTTDWILGIKKIAVPEISETATAKVPEGFKGFSQEDWEELRRILDEHKEN